MELFADDSKVVRGLRRAQYRLRSFGKQVRDIGLRMTAISAPMGAPFVAGIKAAGDAIETINKFKAVFGDQADAAGQFADTIAREIGRSKYEIRDALAHGFCAHSVCPEELDVGGVPVEPGPVNGFVDGSEQPLLVHGVRFPTVWSKSSDVPSPRSSRRRAKARPTEGCFAPFFALFVLFADFVVLRS